MRLLLLSVIFFLISCGGGGDTESVCSSKDEFLLEVNKARAAGNWCSAPMPPLNINIQLQNTAEAFAKELATNNIQAGHIGADGSDVNTRVNRSGYTGFWTGENTAAGTVGAQQTTQAFVGSNGHCQNLMMDIATEVGLACYEINGRGYWVQVFGLQL